MIKHATIFNTCKVILQGPDNCIRPLGSSTLHDGIAMDYSGALHNQIIGSFRVMLPSQIQIKAKKDNKCMRPEEEGWPKKQFSKGKGQCIMKIHNGTFMRVSS